MISIRKIFKKPNTFILSILSFIFIVIFIKNSFSILFFRNQKINVILITIDTLRADHLSCYGYQRKTSPNIDEIAKKGILFTRAISVSSWTPPSMVGIATSNYPHIFGDFVNWAGDRDISLMPTLQGTLKKRDYITAFLSSKPHIGFIRGFRNNFDTFEAHIEDGDDKIARYAINWLNKNKNSRFFLWIHFFGPHGTYSPPPPYDTAFINDNFYKGDRHIPVGTRKSWGWNVIPPEIAERNITDVDYYISQYDGEIAFTDVQIGILWEEIKKLRIDQNTLMIITADHGESLGEHGHYFIHEPDLYDGLVNVPLLIVGGGKVPQGRIITEQVSLIDLVPTILDILAINKPKQMMGSSFFPLMRGEKRKDVYYVFCERDYTSKDEGKGKKAVRTDEWKLIDGFEIERDSYGLYNLKDDPQELNNLASVETDKLQLLKNKLDAWVRQTPFRLPDVKEQPLDEKTKEELRSLGYLQ